MQACKGTSTHHNTVVQPTKLGSRDGGDVSQVHGGRVYVSGSSATNKVKLGQQVCRVTASENKLELHFVLVLISHSMPLLLW